MTALSDLVADPAVGISRGASRCVLLDAQGRVRGWVDPITRERRSAHGRLRALARARGETETGGAPAPAEPAVRRGDDAVGVGLMLLCPLSACEHQPFPSEQRLIAHWAEGHLLAGAQLREQIELWRTRDTASATTTGGGEPMTTNKDYTCRRCGTTGHNARSPECPARGAAGKTDKLTRRRDPKRKAPAPANGFAGVLGALRAERVEIDAAITALERLEARGR